MRPCSVVLLRTVFVVAEILVLCVAVLPSASIAQAVGAALLVGSCALFFHTNNLDRFLINSETPQFRVDLIESVSMGLLTAALLFRLFPRVVPHTRSALLAALLIGILPFVLRMVFRQLVTRGKCVQEILIVGTGDLAAKLFRTLGSIEPSSRRQSAPSLLPNPLDRSIPVDFTGLAELVVRNSISTVVVAEVGAETRERLAAALLDSRLRGIRLSDAVDFYEAFTGKIWLDALSPQWFLYTRGFRRSQTEMCLKRCFDVVFALLLILLSFPIMVLVAIAIKLDSAGPVFFRQVRVGLYGKKFVIYKFRSMRHDPDHAALPSWTAENDERVTRVGRLLRLFRLDEIPQAFNVLKGDMSIVGPRPERPCFVERLDRDIPFYALRHYMRPGITGWAQVMYRYGASVEDSYEKLQYDLFYAKHRSFRCDMGILLRTLRIVLFGRGR